MSKICVIGASRGLGFQLVRQIQSQLPEVEILSVARSNQPSSTEVSTLCVDLSQPQQQQRLIAELGIFQPETVFYVAGGGPYGEYASKKWSDHQWGLEVSFLAPARILHFLLNASFCKQFVAVGSSVAESQPDKNAASYSASKHALRGLITSVNLENPKMQVRLFSPGYMDTDMLPKNASVRKTHSVASPKQVANELWSWSNVSS